MTRTRLATVLAVALLTVLAFGIAAIGTSFAACGLFGCDGGKAAFSPISGQVGLVVCGATLVPFTVLLVADRPLRQIAAAGGASLLVGATLAVVVTGIGPNGCPLGQSRATTQPGAFDAGSLTCSSDRDAG
jgi:hypothetical protein